MYDRAHGPQQARRVGFVWDDVFRGDEMFHMAEGGLRAGDPKRSFVGHEALQHLLATEPGTILPHLCFSGADTLLRVAADRIGPHLCRFMGPLEARRTGELLARIVLSYALAPPPGPPEGAVLSVVREFVVPAAEERSGSGG